MQWMQRWDRNSKLKSHMALVQAQLDGIGVQNIAIDQVELPNEEIVAERRNDVDVKFGDLFNLEAPLLPEPNLRMLSDSVRALTDDCEGDARRATLVDLISDLASGAAEGYETRFMEDLKESLKAFLTNDNAQLVDCRAGRLGLRCI